MINKNKFTIRNTQKKLRKIGKNWITVSVALLGMAGAGLIANTAVHADTTTPATAIVRSANNKPVNQSQTNNDWHQHRGDMFVANKGYGIFKDNWQKAGNTSNQFHRSFKINGAWQNNKGTYYKLFNGSHYVGYTNRNALVNTNQTAYLNVPYVSQWRPISAPEGCAEASLTMLLRYDHKHVNLRYIFNHLPTAYEMNGGQVGNAYGTNGFGHVIKAGALTRYAHHWDKNVRNISGSSINQIKMYVQSGHPVLFYGYSSYQLPGDPNRNHCKVITAYRHGYFRVYDPLYYSKYGQAGTQGRNMMFDRGAVSWYSLKRFAYEYAHISGSNKESALTVMGTPHFEHFAKRVRKPVIRRRYRRHTRRISKRISRKRAVKSSYPAVSHYNSAEKSLANKKYDYAVSVGKQTAMGRKTMSADKEINRSDPFNKADYEAEYLYALSHPALIDGAQDHLGGLMTGIKDGLNDYGQYAAMNATKAYAKQHHESQQWLSHNLVENNRRGFYYWYFMGFNDNNGGDASDAAKQNGQATLSAYHQGLHKAQTVKNSKPTRGMINYTKSHLNNTILSKIFDNLY